MLIPLTVTLGKLVYRKNGHSNCTYSELLWDLMEIMCMECIELNSWQVVSQSPRLNCVVFTRPKGAQLKTRMGVNGADIHPLHL